MRHMYTLVLATVFSANLSTAQDFTNGDLEGNPMKYSELAPGWQAVPFNDPICHAEERGHATPDLTDEATLTSSTIYGRAQHGKTFMSGLDLGPRWHHEGIMQELTNLIPGQEYRIHFYQAVVKQMTILDTSGSWAVYLDDELIGISSVSVSHLDFDDLDLNWDKRSMEFEATKANHTIKFMPVDDDNLYSRDDEGGCLRMGIDNISLEELVDFDIQDELELSLFPNPTLGNFRLKTDTKNYQLTIYDAAGRVVMQKNNCSYSQELYLDQRGVFMVMIKTEDQFKVERIIIQ